MAKDLGQNINIEAKTKRLASSNGGETLDITSKARQKIHFIGTRPFQKGSFELEMSEIERWKQLSDVISSTDFLKLEDVNPSLLLDNLEQLGEIWCEILFMQQSRKNIKKTNHSTSQQVRNEPIKCVPYRCVWISLGCLTSQVFPRLVHPLVHYEGHL